MSDEEKSELLAAAKAVLDGWYGMKGEVFDEDIRRLEEVVAKAVGVESYYAEWIKNLPPLVESDDIPR